MIQFFLGLAMLLLVDYAAAQTIIKARFRLGEDGASFRFIELTLSDGTRVGIDDCSDIAYIEANDEAELPDLEKNLKVEYYDRFDIHDQSGRIKSVGNIVFKYNNTFDIHDKFGTLKSIGDIPISYYNTFDIHDPKGKVKSVGTVRISYYNTFDNKDRFGDLKSIEGNTSKLTVSGSYRPRLKDSERF